MLEELKGVGPKTVTYLNKLGIYNINDLISYYPYRYNFYKPTLLEYSQENQTIVITGTVGSAIKVAFIKRNLNKLSFSFNTGKEIITAVIFNRAFIKNYLTINKQITLIGKYNKQKNLFTANDIKLKPILKEEIEPVYHLINGIKKTNFQQIIKNALTKNIYCTSVIPVYLDNKYKFINLLTSMKYIHTPNSLAEIKQARVRLIYEELFAFMLKINYLKIKNSEFENATIKNYDENTLEKFINSLPYTLTKDQQKALKEIESDFKSKKRMNRLVLGDVGSGKTIVAFISLYINYLSGYKGILMAPTEILAHQHYENCLKTFSSLNLKVAFLTSSVSKKDRAAIINQINNREIDILIGTHSVLNDEIQMPDLGLVITDEQHRFGVKQRQNLQRKGEEVDVLYLSATPIPRTLALTIYGDMDISQIKTKPNISQINTKLVKEKNIKNVLAEMLEVLKRGEQIYVVAPLKEESEEIDLEDVENLYKKINEAFNSKIPMKILHGKVKSKEKEAIMQDFKDNKIKILISTTVIEVGLDIKNATMMVIFNAERFGLATLHQLRGRIGRNDKDNSCIIISDYETERLKVLVESNDGFYISEKDFELRGSGDLFGIKQSGDMNFTLANLKTDYKILLQCKEDSEEFLKNNLINIEQYPAQKNIIDSIAFID